MNGGGDWIESGLRTAARVMLNRGAPRGAPPGDAVRLSWAGVALSLFIDAGVSATRWRVLQAAPESAEAIAAAGSELAYVAGTVGRGAFAYGAYLATVLLLTPPAARGRFAAFLHAQNWGEAVLSAVLFAPLLLWSSLPPIRVEGAQVSGQPTLSVLLFVLFVSVAFVARYRLCRDGLMVSGVRAFWTVLAAFAAGFTALGVLA